MSKLWAVCRTRPRAALLAGGRAGAKWRGTGRAVGALLHPPARASIGVVTVVEGSGANRIALEPVMDFFALMLAQAHRPVRRIAQGIARQRRGAGDMGGYLRNHE